MRLVRYLQHWLSGTGTSAVVETQQPPLMWSDYPGAFEQHLLRRHNNPLFPQSRRIITQTDIDAARERDITDFETLKQELILLLETWLPDRETLFQQNVLGLQSVPLRDIIETRNEIRDRFDTLIQRAMGVGGSAYTLTYNLKELRHVHIQFWTQMVNDPEARRHLQEIDEEYDQAISTFEVPFIAQMRRQDHPMPTDEIVPALLTEKPEIIVKVISDIMAEDPSVHESWQQAAIFILQEAIQEGAEFPNMHEILQALGVSSNSVYAEAVKWYHQAAEQGDANAQNTLGVMYERGTGIPQDSTEAAKWYRQAAEQGLAKAQFNLGLVYAEGTGVPQDSTEALKWYRKAAAQGDPEGQYFLARMYFYGQGAPQDAADAVKWNLRAAEQGHKAAQSSLGILYENGL